MCCSGLLTVDQLAKVTGPLFGLGAHGKLARSIVYQGSESGPIVRTYVKGRNPNSPAQQTQRSFFTTAIDNWTLYDWYLVAVDREAWARWGRYQGPLSGQNAFVREWLKACSAGNEPTDLTTSDYQNSSDPTNWGTYIYSANVPDAHVKLWVGVTPACPRLAWEGDLVDNVANASGIDTEQPLGTPWYWYAEQPDQFARSGVYYGLLTNT